MVKDSNFRSVSSPSATSDSSPRMARRLRSASSTGIGTVYTSRPLGRLLALLALFGLMCQTRRVQFKWIQEDSKWLQAFLGSIFARTLEHRLRLDGSACWWWAPGW